MPYVVSINGRTYHTDPHANNHERSITLDGVLRTLDWRQVAPLAGAQEGRAQSGGHYNVLIDGRSYEIFARRLELPEQQGGRSYEIVVGDERFEVTVEDEREKALAGTLQAAHDTGEAVVRAPMPGLVIGLPLEPGAEVERGQTVAVLEAMKMENDLASPRAGTIKEIRVSKGQTVNQGDVLVVVVGE